jgi:hypothetical protein
MTETCAEMGLEHAWENRGFTDGGGALRFCCSACGAWGWSGRFEPSRIRQYSAPFKSREPAAQPTALPSAERQRGEGTLPAAWVDRRGDRPTWRKDEYTPRFGLDDWDREPMHGGSRRSTGG